MLSLETERLVLRDFLMEDWCALNAILSEFSSQGTTHLFFVYFIASVKLASR